MSNPLADKLANFTKLSASDHRHLDRLASDRVRQFRPRDDILSEGERPSDIDLILSGFACRYKQLEDGRRQIIAFLLPGDLCDHHGLVLPAMDHSIGALTPVTSAKIDCGSLEALMADHRRIARSFWWEALVAAAIQREWTVNLGQRDAFERVAHLLCEIFYRLRSVGLTDDMSCDLPITQGDLADATGMTSVHVNRTLQDLRSRELIVLTGKRLAVLDLAKLRRAALFNANYLHLDREGRHLDANEERDL